MALVEGVSLEIGEHGRADLAQQHRARGRVHRDHHAGVPHDVAHDGRADELVQPAFGHQGALAMAIVFTPIEPRPAR